MSYRAWDDIPPTFRAEYSTVIMDALRKMRNDVVDKGWPTAALVDTNKFFNERNRIGRGLKAVVINDEYLLMYVVGDSWWAPYPILIEEFLLALRPHSDLGAALAVVERIAKDEGCGAVSIGTGAARSDPAYERLLKRHGFKTVAYQLLKEINRR